MADEWCLITEMGCPGTKGLRGKHRARQHYNTAIHLEAAASVPLPPSLPPTFALRRTVDIVFAAPTGPVSSNGEEDVVMTPQDEELPLFPENMELPDSEDSEARSVLARKLSGDDVDGRHSIRH
ncbi:hypothetical protein NM208_g13381 [Fusarium decemcellulare]|uniref:Uncharacterized protein n=1 Tax=Fusarium decemcellulare TaxID=57161 RepID=A0ACC1RNK4_9HYPO|nr:hypothetical protein NM208_g13381 [Fusarium decemcellulare]